MTVLCITAQDAYPRPHASACGSRGALKATLAQLTRPQDTGKPIVIMVHGFKYAPGVAPHCPHDTIFAEHPNHRDLDPRIISWPRHLHMTRKDAGHAISFGWHARGSINQAYRDAALAGHALAHLVTQIQTLCPDRPVHAIGHSLGARVILSALAQPDAKPLTRAILLAPAEFSETARHAMTSRAGQQTETLIVSSRENDLFDLMLELFVKPETYGDRMIGHQGITRPNVRTLQLDHADSLKALKTAGFPIAPPKNRVCHWSPYLRPGVFRLYRAFLSGKITVNDLRAILPSDMTPRWSRLLPALTAKNRKPPMAAPAGGSLPNAG